MKIRVCTVSGGRLAVYEREWGDAEFSFDAVVLEVRHGGETTIFPLTNVISFTTSESVSP